MAEFNLGEGAVGDPEMALLGDALNLFQGLFGDSGTETTASQVSASEQASEQRGKAQTL